MFGHKFFFGFRVPVCLRDRGTCWEPFYYANSVCYSKQSHVPEQYLGLRKIPSSANSQSSLLGKSPTKNSKAKSVLKKEYLYGISPCLAALEANRRKFHVIYLNDDALNMKSRHQFKEIISTAEKRMIAIKAVSRRRLDDLCGSRPHQNIVMKVSSLSMIPLEKEDRKYCDLNSKKAGHRPPLWLVLEGIQDPMNMGAILRTSAYLGVDKVISSESDSCSLTPTVSKASAGAMEGLPLYSTNVRQLLKEKIAENWEILGTVHPRFVPQNGCPPVITCDQFQLQKPSLLVLGNEGSGLTAEAQALCTTFLTIQSHMSHSFGDLDSLNVSVATGILLYSVLSSRNHLRTDKET